MFVRSCVWSMTNIRLPCCFCREVIVDLSQSYFAWRRLRYVTRSVLSTLLLFWATSFPYVFPGVGIFENDLILLSEFIKSNSQHFIHIFKSKIGSFLTSPQLSLPFQDWQTAADRSFHGQHVKRWNASFRLFLIYVIFLFPLCLDLLPNTLQNGTSRASSSTGTDLS